MKTCLILLFGVFLISPYSQAQSELDHEVKNYERAVRELPQLVVLRMDLDGNWEFAQLPEAEAGENAPQSDWVFTEVQEDVPYQVASPNELDGDTSRESWFITFGRCCGPAWLPYYPRVFFYGYNYNYVFYRSYIFGGYVYYYFRPWWY